MCSTALLGFSFAEPWHHSCYSLMSECTREPGPFVSHLLQIALHQHLSHRSCTPMRDSQHVRLQSFSCYRRLTFKALSHADLFTYLWNTSSTSLLSAEQPSVLTSLFHSRKTLGYDSRTKRLVLILKIGKHWDHNLLRIKMFSSFTDNFQTAFS